ncbi:MAG TPA: hydrolase [Isosphaeraceae bacterium]
MASSERFTSDHSALLVVDVQGKLMERVERREPTLANIVRLVKSAELLGIPVFATEQYPKGLGPSVPEVAGLIPQRFEKTTFHCCAAGLVLENFYARGIRKVTLAGIEAHVCVAQTALELMTMNFRVQVPADAVSSRHAFDRDIALRRLELTGAVVTTTEAAIFEWTETADHPQFKAISALIKEADLTRNPAK